MRVNTMEEAAEAVALTHRMLALLTEMATLPYGSVMNYNASGGRSSEHPGGRRPTGVEHSDQDRFRARWEACRTVRDGRECVKAAEACLEEWRHSKAQDAGETQKQLYQRIVRVGEGWDARDCAASLRQTVKTVQDARRAHERDPAKGLPLAGASSEELLRRGNSVRVVAALVGAKKSTVYDKARKAA